MKSNAVFLFLVMTLGLVFSSSSFATEQTVTTEQVQFLVPSININTATANELIELKGIGKSKAAAIITYRDAHGPFTSIEQLAEVKGVSLKMVETNRSMLSI